MTSDSLEKWRREVVDNAIWVPEDASEDLRHARTQHSLYRYLLDQITLAAKEYAYRNNTSDQSLFEDVLYSGIEVVDGLRLSLTRDHSYPDPRKDWNFWRHEELPFARIRSNDAPYIDRSELESTVTRYLALPYRAQAVDRLLVDVLVAAEVYAFGNEMWNAPYFRFLPGNSPLKEPHAIWQYVKGQFWSAMLFGAIAASALWLNGKGIVGSTAAGWTVGIAVLLFLFSFLLVTGRLPFVWFYQSKARRKVGELFHSMGRVYQELKSDGPISARHILEESQKAAALGVIWPAPLFALLDDIIARSGRF